MKCKDHAVVLPAGCAGRVSEFIRSAWQVVNASDASDIERVVHRYETDWYVQRVKNDGVLRMQMDDGIHVWPLDIGPLMQLPFAGWLGLNVCSVALKSHLDEVVSVKPI